MSFPARPVTPLTPDQKALVEKGIFLVYHVLKRWLRRHPGCRGLPKPDLDNMISRGYLALCRAAKRWDPAKATWGSFAGHYVWHEFTRYFARERPLIHVATSKADAGHTVPVAALPAHAEDVLLAPAVVDREEVVALLARLAPLDARMLRRHYLDGVSHRDMALEEGLTRQGITQRVRLALAHARLLPGALP